MLASVTEMGPAKALSLRPGPVRGRGVGGTCGDIHRRKCGVLWGSLVSGFCDGSQNLRWRLELRSCAE